MPRHSLAELKRAHEKVTIREMLPRLHSLEAIKKKKGKKIRL